MRALRPLSVTAMAAVTVVMLLNASSRIYAADGATDVSPDAATLCDLPCADGSTCRLGGRGEDGGTSTWPPNLVVPTDPAPFLDETTDSRGMYCDCPPDMTGLLCDHPYRYCWKTIIGDAADAAAASGVDPTSFRGSGGDGGGGGGGVVIGDGFVCFHGGTCVAPSDLTKKSDPSAWRCDCSQANHDGAEFGLFAGRRCEHRATSVCYGDDEGGNGWSWFCANGGKCMDGTSHEFCDCALGWTGPHCEIATGTASVDSAQGGGGDVTETTSAQEQQQQLQDQSVGTENVVVDDDGDGGSGQCAMSCPHGGTCRRGPADFGVLDTSRAGEPIMFLQQTSNARGEHCASCPQGRTGFDCSREVEWCWEIPGDEAVGADGGTGSIGQSLQEQGLSSNYPIKDGFACFHGGKCYNPTGNVRDLDGWKCDCREAHYNGQDGGMFAGRHCEHRATAICFTDDFTARIGFCANGGRCASDNADPNRICECTPGWAGPHCEYAVLQPEEGGGSSQQEQQIWSLPTEDNSFPPPAPAPVREDCSLHCPAGSSCRKGLADFGPLAESALAPGEAIPFLQRKNDANGEHCSCPEGQTGYNCQNTYEYCWEKPGMDGTIEEGFACFNGGVCYVEDGASKMDLSSWKCDCAVGLGGDGPLFAGHQCEHISTDICFSDDYKTMVGFCVKGGSCVEGETDQNKMCDCLSGWAGPHCEFRSAEEVTEETASTVGPSEPDPDCSLNCRNGGVCKKGNANFGILDMSREGEPVSFLQRTSDTMGEYCECPVGWTGIDCSHQYEYCWEEPKDDGTWGDGFACFHGGECVHATGDYSDLSGWGCNCSVSHAEGTFEGYFAGTHCENAPTALCLADNAQALLGFCTNGGKCIEGEADQSKMCDCKDGKTGPHCEFTIGKTDKSFGTPADEPAPFGDQFQPAEDCSLTCAHGGICQTGKADYGSLETTSDGGPISFLNDKNNSFGHYCECPNGWTGIKCEHEYEYCWEKPDADGTWIGGFACFHGSRCVNDSGDEEDQSAWRCDCTSASWYGYDHGLFGGYHCEQQATDVCTEGGKDGWIGFCVNGGKCIEGETDQSKMCNCPSGWAGHFCEFVDESVVGDEEDCSLDCFDSVCRKGSANFGILDSTSIGEPIPFLQGTSSARGEYCECPEGWTGIECSYKYKICWEKLGDNGTWESGFSCFHGSQCVNDSEDEEDLSAWRCDCSAATSDISGHDQGLFAGKHCQHQATDVCTKEDEDDRIGFCVNGGKCITGESDQSKMCNCPPGWTGPHCESAAESADIEADCSTECSNDGKCRKGSTDYGILDTVSINEPIPFLQEKSNARGEYCECPEGWTGIECDYEYEYCWEKPGANGTWESDFVCFHGSECINDPGDEANSTGWWCDCSAASLKLSGLNHRLFAGKHCQYQATDVCMEKDGGDEIGFCVNGGKCRKGVADQTEMCQCTSGWTGPHCEFALEKPSIADDQSNSPVDCSLKCFNDGVCRKGNADFGILDTTSSSELIPFLQKTSDIHNEYCECPAGWTGIHCDYKYEFCWEMPGADGKWQSGFACFHGGQCLNDSEDDKNKTSWKCDCSTAALDLSGYDHGLFAGKHCQYQATDVCTEGGKDSWIGFCVNGGKCRKGETDQGTMCTCESGWTGPHCEFSDEGCTLQCKHGGRCNKGPKDYGRINDFDIPFLGEDHVDFEHCECPEGYTGLDCSVQIDFCNEHHVCLHGSECIAHDNAESGEKKFGCDCGNAMNSQGDLVAGDYCEYVATEYCSLGVSSDFASFCTNGGTCVSQIVDGKNRTGCRCPSGWAGDHCEYKLASLNAETSRGVLPGQEDTNKHAAILFSFMATIIASIIIIAVLLTRQLATAESKDRNAILNLPFSPRKERPIIEYFEDGLNPSSTGEISDDGSVGDVDDVEII